MIYKNKYIRQKQQYSNDGGINWYDVTPENYRKGGLIEEASEDCNDIEWIEVEDTWYCVSDETIYRWVADGTTCDGYDKYVNERKQFSNDGGNTWTDTQETQRGELIERNSIDCGYNVMYRWVTVVGEYVCSGTTKFTKEKQQVSTDNGQTWSDVTPLYIRQGTLIERDSEDCGYIPLYRWVTVVGEYMCVGSDKYTKECKQVSMDNGQTWENTEDTRQGTLIERDSEDCGTFEDKYLTFEAIDNCVFSIYSSNSSAISWSKDDGTTWNSYNGNVSVSAGEKILWKGISSTNTLFSCDSGRFNVFGNVMSVLYGDNFEGQTVLTSSLPTMFYGCTGLVSAENLILPATTLTTGCYSGMFNRCSSLVNAPALPATTLAYGCYSEMFRYCTSLVNAPQLPATTLATRCYDYMFSGCTSLTTAPELPATTLAERCYSSMFKGCTSLNYIKCLATDISATNCTNEWLYNVAATGTFVKAASMSGWSTGSSGVPSGWTVVSE